MESQEFRAAAHQMIDYIIAYHENIRSRYCAFSTYYCLYINRYLYCYECRRVLPTVQPGYIRSLIPDEAPENGDSWADIFQDIERVIMPGVRK